MDSLKRILTVMVVILIMIIVVGGVYTFGMGNMNHGKSGQMTMNAGQDQSTDGLQQKQENAGSETASNQHKMTAEQQKESAGQQQTATDQTNQQKSGEAGKQVPPTGWAPVIVQNPPPAANKETQFYIAQLKEKMKAINEANSQIASNSDGAMTVRQNGDASTGQSNMNELHQGFYKLGQSVTEMEQTIDNLDRETQNPTNAGPGVQNYYVNPPATPYYPYGYPQNNAPDNYQYPYTPNMNMNNQYQGQPQEPVQQGQNHTGQSSDQMSGMQMNQNTPMNHGINTAGLFNSKTLSLVFTLILLGSIILAIIAIVGFISSLFKRGSAPRENLRMQ